jgi:signal transduction histidine kinase
LCTYTHAFDRREPIRIEYRLRRHDGAYRWVLNTGVPRFTSSGAFAGYIGSCVDVTEHKRAQEALSGLSRKLMEAQESERARIARELHDDVGQRMALLAIELERLRQTFRRPRATSEMGLHVRELCGRAVDLGKDIQALSHRLHSSKLEYMGITVAAAGLCKDLCKRQRVQIDFSHDGVPTDLPKEVALCLFRVLEEALTNAVKHASVSHFAVGLRGSADEIQLEVVDRGVGFDVDAVPGSQGLGLISMQERLNLVNGGIVIESRRGVGTTIRARVPLRSAGNEAVDPETSAIAAG